MELRISESKDSRIIADISKTVQDIHKEKHPSYFKTYNHDAFEEEIRKTLNREYWYSFIAYADDFPAGYAIFYIRHYDENPFRYGYKALHVDQICVMREYQRMNIGTLLMKKIEDFAIEYKMNQIELTYWENNFYAAKFYKKHGFEAKMHFAVKRLK